MTEGPPSEDAISTNSVGGVANNMVQASTINGGVHVTQLGSDNLYASWQAQSDVIAVYRRLDDVQAQLVQMQQKMLESVAAERNITQVVLLLQLMLMRMQDKVTHLTWQSQHYQREINCGRNELTRTRRELKDARLSQERTRGQLDRALDERSSAMRLISALQRRIDFLEQQLRALNADGDLAQDVVSDHPPGSYFPFVDATVDLDGVDGIVDRIGAYLDKQHDELSRVAEVISSPFSAQATPAAPAEAVMDPAESSATRDELTGLLNRHGAMRLLRTLLDGDVDNAKQICVLLCDIDNFKRVNDSLGHDAGDELLVALARRLEGELPESCTAARLFGDEYVIICEDIAAAGGVDVLATRVAGLLRTAVPVCGQLVRVSASIGAAVPQGTRTSGADLLRFADAAMFEAKRAGSGRVSLASAALIESADRQVHLEGQLQDALARDSLTLHYQPVVGVDGSVQAAEALVRWPHPDRGLLGPEVFLPVAEQGDLMWELDRWVLRTALTEAASWPEPGGKPVAVAVNLSGLVPGDPDFVDVVAAAVAEAGIAWDRVVLELVETALVDLPSRTRKAMGELVERGVRFAVDDFGTGYSSLARLNDLPAQILKVDRKFVAGLGSDASSFAVARAVVDMARAMDRVCVAEGVETATQFHVLRGMGVNAYQGWLFCRPVPLREFRSVLALGPLHVPRAG